MLEAKKNSNSKQRCQQDHLVEQVYFGKKLHSIPNANKRQNDSFFLEKRDPGML